MYLLKQRTVFGHWGAGGQSTFCDPDYQLGCAYITNYSNILHSFIIDHRYQRLRKQCINVLKYLTRTNNAVVTYYLLSGSAFCIKLAKRVTNFNWSPAFFMFLFLYT